MKIIKDYRQFIPGEFLKEYYAQLGIENRALLDFFHRVYQLIPTQNRLLEIGGGPTIYQLISASSKVNEIVFSEYLAANRKEIEKWLKEDSSAYNWDKYFHYVLKLEGRKTSKTNLSKIKTRLRNKIKEIIKCDLFQTNPIGPKRYNDFGVVSVNFCVEAVSDKERDFLLFMSRITKLVRKKGYLVMSICKRASYWKLGDLYFVNFPVDEKYMANLLKKLNFKILILDSIPNEFDQGYEGIIFLLAKNEPGHP